jgi:hypothetical protein
VLQYSCQILIFFLTSSSSLNWLPGDGEGAPREPPTARLAATEEVEQAINLRVEGKGRADAEEEVAIRGT